MPNQINSSKIIRYNTADWIQVKENTGIRGVKTILRKSIIDRQLRNKLKLSALDKLHLKQV